MSGSLTVELGDQGDRVSVSGIGCDCAGAGGADTLLGSSLDDELSGGDRTDVLQGRRGNDTLDGGGGPDDLAGGADTDTATYASRGPAVTIDIDDQPDDGRAPTGQQAPATTSADDLLTGSPSDNGLDGGPGGDTLNGGSGGDTLDGGDAPTISPAGRI